MFPFSYLFPKQPDPPIAVNRIKGYLVETVPCATGGCSSPFHTRVTFLDPWTGAEVGRCAHTWDHRTFLGAVNGHHRVLRSLCNQCGPDYELATKQTCVGGGVRRRGPVWRCSTATGQVSGGHEHARGPYVPSDGARDLA